MTSGQVALIEAQLREDRAKLDSFKNMLGRSSALTTSMKERLTQFDDRLLRLKGRIMPVYEEMQIKIRAQSNSELAVRELEKVARYYCIREELDKTINGAISAQSIPDYIAHMKDLAKAIRFFLEHNPGSNEVANLQALFRTGVVNLCREYEELLKRRARKIPVEEFRREDLETVLPLLPSDVKANLRLISSWVPTALQYLPSGGGGTEGTRGQPDYVRELRDNFVKAQKRYLRESMERLAEHEQLPMFGNVTPLFGRKAKNAEITRKGSKLSRTDMKRQSKRGHKRTASDHNSIQVIKEEINVEKSTGSFERLAFYFAQLIRAVYYQIHELVPPKHQESAFVDTIEGTMTHFEGEGVLLVKAAKEQILNNNWVTLFPLLTLYKGLNKIKYSLISVDQLDLEVAPLSPISSLISQVTTCVKETLDQFKLFVKEDSVRSSNIATDGTVHQLTSNVMSICGQLLLHRETVGTLLQGVQHEGTRQLQLSIIQRAVSQYIAGIITALERNLAVKSEQYENKCLSALFLMNNYNYIRKYLKEESELSALLARPNEIEPEEKYADLMERQKELYRLWYRPLTDACTENTGSAVKRESEKAQKEAVKSRFKTFNNYFLEQWTLQKKWAIPDPEFREGVRIDNINAVMPCYQDMYEQYRDAKFTSKNPGKYIEYTPDQIEKLLLTFFDQ